MLFLQHPPATSALPAAMTLIADQYHRKCLELLIPILSDRNAALDESLYAATVILRLYEEISGNDT